MSKLAWHFQQIPDWSKQGWINSEYVKLIDPPSDNPFPGKKVIGRIYIPDNETNQMIWNGSIGAATWINAVLPKMNRCPYIYAWELPNEPQPVEDFSFCVRLGEFTTVATSILHNNDKKVIGGCLSVGQPVGQSDADRSAKFCAIARGLQFCDGWSYHSYWTPDGYPHPKAGYNDWFALHYRVNRDYANAQGINLPPVFLTEGGWDFGIVDKPRQGWRSYSGWERYFADLKRFDRDLMDDSNVACCTLFISGAGEDWADFEIGEPESRQLADYITYTPNPVPTPIPPPQPEPKPCITIVRPLPSNRGSISQHFGENVGKYLPLGFAGHEGLDYACPVGTTVYASEKGIVKFAGWGTGANAAYGLYIVIDHGEFETWYCHLSVIMVKIGETVAQKRIIGKTGNTGTSTGPHLHYAIRVPKTRNASKGFVDPWAIRVILGDA